MEFDGTVELEGVTTQEAWLLLSDPVAIQKALPGCEVLTRIEEEPVEFPPNEPSTDDETLPTANPMTVSNRAFQEGEQYAVLIKLGVGGDHRDFEAQVHIESRQYPRMRATGRGSSAGSTVDVTSSVEIAESETGSQIEWTAETKISGRLSQLDRRVLVAATYDIVNRFFTNLQELIEASSSRDTSDG